ncbi:MAG TPA: histidine kinase [Bacteroidia bacterium]|nr:histidine kinase [Bacteroidia bacterium]
MIKSTSYKQTILQYTGLWICLTVIQTLVLHRLHIEWQTAFTDASISNILLALAGYIIVNTYRFYTPGAASFFYRAGYAAVLAFICLTLMKYALSKLFSENNSYLLFLDESLPLRFMFFFLMIAFMTMVSLLRYSMLEQEQNKKRKDEAEKLLRDAELSRLRQQLQPHFLFNSLNSISALAGSRPEEARKMIQQLSDFLRGTLKKDDQQLVNFSDELQHLQLYLEIEKVRFGHRLNTSIKHDDMSANSQLPSLLLQPVVENAIKFGLYDTTGEIMITIHAETKDKLLNIRIENPFDPSTSKPKQGTGFGLSAVQRRLHLLYGRNDLLTAEPKENIFVTTLKIPQNV